MEDQEWLLKISKRVGTGIYILASFIFESGTEYIGLFLYPAVLLFATSFLVIALGTYQRLSILTEKDDWDESS